MSRWEVAAYVLGSAAMVGGIVFFAREFVRDGRKHRVANQRIGDAHQSAILPAQAWQQSCGAGTTAFPASHPRHPSRWDAVWAWLWQAWALARGGDRFATPGGQHTPTVGWSAREVAQQLAAGSDLTAGQVAEIARQEFNAGLTAGRVPAVGSMPARLPWDVVDRAKGRASVPLPFDEQIRARNEVLRWLVRADAAGEPTRFMSIVQSGGAR